MDPPELSLRADFTRNLPHMQPWLADGRPVPCIYDGDLAELLHREGLAGILNQTAIWLERAALGTLIDPEQGWESVRRDSFNDVVVADAAHLQGLVNRRGGHRFLKIDYLKFFAADGTHFVHSQVANEVVRVNRASVGSIFGEAEISGDVRLHRVNRWRWLSGPANIPRGNRSSAIPISRRRSTVPTASRNAPRITVAGEGTSSRASDGCRPAFTPQRWQRSRSRS